VANEGLEKAELT